MNNVLVVDDNIALADSMYQIFEHVGYSVRLAHDGIDAWNQVQTEIPDIIVADINMPGMNGFDFLQHVRNYQGTETTPFIFVTARLEREIWRQGMVLGADDYITKPFSAKELIESVQTTISKRKKIDDNHETTLSLLRKNISYALPHELRTPLMSIVGYADIMQADYQTLSPDDILMMSGEIAKAGGRLARIIENTLAYAQIELIASDPQQLKHLRNNILPNTAEIIQSQAEKIAEKWRRIDDLKLQLENHVLRISSQNLLHVIDELVDNAFKFSHAGTPVTIKAIKAHSHYMIVIHDQGRGMSSEQLEHIGPFIQFDRTMYEQQGCGLGLIIAKRLIELHKGTMQIESMPDDGTIITITFVS